MKVLNTRIGDLPTEAVSDPRLPRLAEWGGTVPEEVAGRPEKVVFSLPKVLRSA